MHIFTSEIQDFAGFSFGHRSTPTVIELVRGMLACSIFAQELEQPQKMFAEKEEAETNATTQGDKGAGLIELLPLPGCTPPR